MRNPRIRFDAEGHWCWDAGSVPQSHGRGAVYPLPLHPSGHGDMLWLPQWLVTARLMSRPRAAGRTPPKKTECKELKALGPSSRGGRVEASFPGGVGMVIFLASIRGFSFARCFAGGKWPARGVCKTNVDGLPLTPPRDRSPARESAEVRCTDAARPARGLCGQGGSSWAQDLLVLQITGAPGIPGTGRHGCVRTHVAGATAEAPRSAHAEALGMPSTGLPRPGLAPGLAPLRPPSPAHGARPALPPALSAPTPTHPAAFGRAPSATAGHPEICPPAAASAPPRPGIWGACVTPSSVPWQPSSAESVFAPARACAGPLLPSAGHVRSGGPASLGSTVRSGRLTARNEVTRNGTSEEAVCPHMSS